MLIMFTTVGALSDTNDDYPQLTVATPTPLFLLTICLDQSTIQGLTVILTPYNPSTRKLCQMNEIMIDITCRINTGKKNSSFLKLCCFDVNKISTLLNISIRFGHLYLLQFSIGIRQN